MTFEEFKTRACNDDHFDALALESEVVLQNDGFILLKGSGGENGKYCPDIRVELLPDDRLRAWVRDPATGTDEPCFGPEWSLQSEFDEYVDLVSWAYSL